MAEMKVLLLVFLLWGFLFYFSEGLYRRPCKRVFEKSGKVYQWSNFGDWHECWNISVSPNHFIRLQMTELETNFTCEEYNITIRVAGSTDVYKFCKSEFNKNPVLAFDDVTIDFMVIPSTPPIKKFTIEYAIKTRECLNRNSFECDAHSCVSENKVCDGVRDCENGKDEKGCKRGLHTIKEVPEIRKNAINWLKNKRRVLWGWGENTPRAIIALYLASDAASNDTFLERELMTTQTVFKTAAAVMGSSLTTRSILINALLVTCQDPRQFYGSNLVKLLKEQVEESGNFTHPLAYLTLCNAGEPWPLKAKSTLLGILGSDSEYPFAKDLQAFAVMALRCEDFRSRSNLSTYKDYIKTVLHFEKLQARDGTFGNIHTTALITQALFSTNREQSSNWNLNATIKYLMKELKSPNVDFLATYLALPVLNGKSLVDISKVKCSDQVKRKDDPFEEINDYLVPTMQVKYSLYVGDKNPFIHSLSFTVPKNSTAFEVMKLADNANRKYKFEWKMVEGNMYVYEIASIKNDPEVGKFWLLYVGSANSSKSLTHLTIGPDEIIMEDGDHLVFWYKTATV